MQGKVEICGVNTAKLPVLKAAETRIQPVSAEDYNARRTHPSRGWYAIAKYNHTRRWRILLEKLELPIYNHVDTPRISPQFKVNIFSDTDFLK